MWAEAAILSASVLVAAFCATIAGFAFVMIAAGLLLHVLPPTLTGPVLVLGSLLVQGLAVRPLWKEIAWPRMRLYLGLATLGIPVGLVLLARGPAPAIVAGVGALLVIYAGYMLARTALGLAPPRLAAGRLRDAAVAFAAGILGGVGGYVGALPALWVDIQGLSPREARALLQPFIACMQGITAIGLALGGFLTAEVLWLTASAVPAMLAGSWLGQRALRVLPAQGFRILLLALLLLSGLSLVV